MVTIAQLLRLGLKQHGDGRLADAERFYSQVLELDPENADALHLLGVLAQQAGNAARAAELIERALLRQPDNPVFLSNLGETYRQLGRMAEAEACCRKALALKPDYAEARTNLAAILKSLRRLDAAEEELRRVLQQAPAFAQAHNALGSVLQELGRHAESEAAYRRALELEPLHAETRYNLGTLLQALGRDAEAEAAYRQAVELRPQYPEALNNLAAVLQKLGRASEAEASYRRALAVRPDYAQALNNLGHLQQEAGRASDAEASYRRALEIRPGYAEAYYNLGNLLRDAERYAQAEAAYRSALQHGPGDARTYNNLANLLQKLNRFAEAEAAFRRALEIRPQYPEANWNLGILKLALGEFAQGWDLYEWRKKIDDIAPAHVRFPYPHWDGSGLAGRTVLVYAEQGLGDEIMFASCVPELMTQAARVLLECDSRLAELFRRSFAGCSVVARGGALEARPDVQVASASLGLHLRRRREQFPPHRGYLVADARKVERWRSWLDTLGAGRKIGLSWRGGLAHTGRAQRSIDLRALAALLQIEGVRFVSLQYGAVQDEIEAFQRESGVPLAHPEEAIRDTDQGAALVCALDGVVSVCNSLVHLTGALGRPALVMAPFSAEWRYGASGETMLWYPSVRILRQPAPGKWSPVLDEVRARLSRP